MLGRGPLVWDMMFVEEYMKWCDTVGGEWWRAPQCRKWGKYHRRIGRAKTSDLQTDRLILPRERVAQSEIAKKISVDTLQEKVYYEYFDM